jgi:hypothetical protein
MRKFTAIPGKGIFAADDKQAIWWSTRDSSGKNPDMDALAAGYEQALTEMLADYGLSDDIASVSVRPRSTKTFAAYVKATSKKHHGKSFKLSSFKPKDAETALTDFAYEINAQFVNGDKLQKALAEDAYVRLYSINGIPIGYYRESVGGRGAYDRLTADPNDAEWIADPIRAGYSMSSSDPISYHTYREFLIPGSNPFTVHIWGNNRLRDITAERVNSYREWYWAVFIDSICDGATLEYTWMPLSEAAPVTRTDRDAVIDLSQQYLQQYLDA